MRLFTLYLDGTAHRLNGESGYWLTDVSGLGVNFNNVSARMNDGFFFPSNREQKQVEVVGTLTFTSHCMTTYHNLIGTIMRAKKIVLEYNPDGGSYSYNAPCHLNYVTKGESVCGVLLSCQISFSLDGMWYRTAPITSGTGSITISPDSTSQVPAGIKLTFRGPLTNPSIKIRPRVQSTVLSPVVECNLTMQLAANETIEYCNYYDDCHLNKISGNVWSEIIQYADLTKSIYARSGVGDYRNFDVIVTDDNSATPSINVTTRSYWRTV